MKFILQVLCVMVKTVDSTSAAFNHHNVLINVSVVD